MLSDQALRHALERIGVDAPVRFDEVTVSTQRTALELAGSGAPEWTLVAAGHQTTGRGRLGREWLDEPGSGLLFSLVLRPDLPPERGGMIPLLAGACVAYACREIAAADARCKWPNDVLVGGRKAGGILAESLVADGRFVHVVLGVGVNLGAAPAGLPDAAAVGDVDPTALLGAFLDAFARRYEPGHPAFPGAVLALYRPMCDTLGKTVRAATAEGGVVEGEAVDVDGSGALVVRTPVGLEVVRFGEIEHLEG